jgi:serine/threonine-protein phosphatase 2B regulatory subunit
MSSRKSRNPIPQRLGNTPRLQSQSQLQSQSTLEEGKDGGLIKPVDAQLLEKHQMRRGSAVELVRKRAHKVLDDPELNEDVTQEKIDEFGELFNLVDNDGSGSIDKEELVSLLTMAMGSSLPTPEELDMIYAEVDADGGGDIGFDEFVNFMTQGVVTSFTRNKLKSAFATLETPELKGRVTRQALEKSFKEYLPEFVRDDQDCENLFGHLQFDANGSIDHVKYVKKYIAM